MPQALFLLGVEFRELKLKQEELNTQATKIKSGCATSIFYLLFIKYYMFNFINEFFNDINVTTNKAVKSNSFKYVCFNGEIFYIQNFKDIISFSDEEVVIKLFNGELCVLGKNLRLIELSKKFICLKGKIENVEVHCA